jgi:hypothetical protein
LLATADLAVPTTGGPRATKQPRAHPRDAVELFADDRLKISAFEPML